MTNDMWLGPKIPALKELVRLRHQVREGAAGSGGAGDVGRADGGDARDVPAGQQGDGPPAEGGDKLAGTPLDTTTTFESVKSKEQLTQAQASSSSSSGGGISGMLAKKMHQAGAAEGALDDLHHAITKCSR